jgi:hypothetical protein
METAPYMCLLTTFDSLSFMHPERKKATRKLRKVRQSIEQTQDETELAKLNEQLKEALVDEAYIQVSRGKGV